MPAVMSLAMSGAATLARTLAILAQRAQHIASRVAEHIRNRHEAMRLADLDDRMLADIGLCRSDLRDAYAEPPWRDPSDVLARRAAERRRTRPHAG